MASMSEEPKEHLSRARKSVTERLGEWEYPNATGDSGAYGADISFFHLQLSTTDSLEQVRQYYWNLIRPNKPMPRGSLYSPGGDKPWFIFRSPQHCKGGSYTMIAHATDERTIFVVIAPTTQDNELNIYITFEVH
ncbi:hypothetical protein H8E77_26400 [bacterium]|nr:hypothetical protein [bacterium]